MTIYVQCSDWFELHRWFGPIVIFSSFRSSNFGTCAPPWTTASFRKHSLVPSSPFPTPPHVKPFRLFHDIFRDIQYTFGLQSSGKVVHRDLLVICHDYVPPLSGLGPSSHYDLEHSGRLVWRSGHTTGSWRNTKNHFYLFQIHCPHFGRENKNSRIEDDCIEISILIFTRRKGSSLIPQENAYQL